MTTINDIKTLRAMTGVGITACRDALNASHGDMTSALELLRARNLTNVVARQDRPTSNGLVTRWRNTMLMLTCETDFVAKSSEFIAFADMLVVYANTVQIRDVDALAAHSIRGVTIPDMITDLSAKTGEHITLAHVETLPYPHAIYLHKTSMDLPPQIGAAIIFDEEPGADRAAAAGIAMHVAACSPRYLSRADIPADVMEREIKIGRERATLSAQSGRENYVDELLADTELMAFYNTTVLLDQPYIVQPTYTVKNVADNAKIAVTGFMRLDVTRS